MSPAQRSVAAAVAVLAVVGVIVVVLVLGDGRGVATGSPGGAPTPSPTHPLPTAGEASDEPDESPPTGDEALAILAEIEDQVEEIRGLPPAEIGPPELITRAELEDELLRLFDEDYPPEEREADNITLRAFGLLTPDQDVAELQLELLGEGVLGFYDDTERRMVVVTDAGLDASAKLTYAHEYTHALQDAAFVLDSLETDAVGEDDRGLARTTLIEGDATVTMLAWAFRHMTQEEILELQEMPVPDTSGIPSWMVAQLDFPYTAGQLWVSELVRDPFSPDFTEVDAAYADPPDSTEQVLNIEKWRSREAPVPVEVPDLAVTMGAEWQHVDTSPVGEASIAIMLEYFGVEPAEVAPAAQGWGGDRATVATGPGGDWALVWRLAWDTPADGTQFVAAYEQVVGELPFAASVRPLADGGVLVVHGSSQAVHDAAVTAAGE